MFQVGIDEADADMYGVADVDLHNLDDDGVEDADEDCDGRVDKPVY